jgi:hypothetical protein
MGKRGSFMTLVWRRTKYCTRYMGIHEQGFVLLEEEKREGGVGGAAFDMTDQ